MLNFHIFGVRLIFSLAPWFTCVVDFCTFKLMFIYFQTPVTKILKSCSNMVVSVLSYKDLVPESLSMLEEATAAVISKAK